MTVLLQLGLKKTVFGPVNDGRCTGAELEINQMVLDQIKTDAHVGAEDYIHSAAHCGIAGSIKLKMPKPTGYCTVYHT